MKTSCPACEKDADVEGMDIFCDSCGKLMVHDDHTVAKKVDLHMSIKCPTGCGSKATIEDIELYCPSCNCLI